MTFFNAHTHQLKHSQDVVFFYNHDIREPLPELPSNCYFTTGLHPWWINDMSWEEAKEKIQQFATHDQFIGVGETGIDTAIEDDKETQYQIFLSHLKLAIELKRDLVIIHCVHAYNEIIRGLKESGYKGKLLLHDFNSNEQVRDQLLKQDCYFSFGKGLYDEISRGCRSFPSTPIERIVLETDVETELPIESVYEKASSLLEMPVAEVETKILANYNRLIQ